MTQRCPPKNCYGQLECKLHVFWEYRCLKDLSKRCISLLNVLRSCEDDFPSSFYATSHCHQHQHESLIPTFRVGYMNPILPFKSTNSYICRKCRRFKSFLTASSHLFLGLPWRDVIGRQCTWPKYLRPFFSKIPRSFISAKYNNIPNLILLALPRIHLSILIPTAHNFSMPSPLTA